MFSVRLVLPPALAWLFVVLAPVCGQAATQPPIVLLSKANALPLSIDPKIQFRKTKTYFLESPQVTGIKAGGTNEEQSLTFERRRLLYGAITGSDTRDKYGNYYTFFWRALRPADLTLRLEYRQQKTAVSSRPARSITRRQRCPRHPSQRHRRRLPRTGPRLGLARAIDRKSPHGCRAGPVLSLAMKTTPLLSPTNLPPLGVRPGLTGPLANGYLSPNKVEVNPTPSILVGCSQKVVCIRVQGKGSFQNSTGIKDFAAAMILRGHRDFVVDLAGCPVMDSTFMGTLAGVAQRLLRLGQGGLHIVHANERNTDLLVGLGLDQIVSMEGKEGAIAAEFRVEPQDELPNAPSDKRTTTETMIAAHQALVDADPDNLCKFKDVLDYLKQDLRREETVD